MQVSQTKLAGVLLVEPRVFGDNRGWFMESYSASKLKKLGIATRFIQDNHSYSAERGTLRGLHCQMAPKAQTKLVRCTRGAILDVVVDVRAGSPTYRQWIGVRLDADNRRQLYIPKGLLHGFITLVDDVEIEYKVDVDYSPAHDRCVRFDDPALAIDWEIANPILSDKDRNAPSLQESDVHFAYKEGA